MCNHNAHQCLGFRYMPSDPYILITQDRHLYFTRHVVRKVIPSPDLPLNPTCPDLLCRDGQGWVDRGDDER
jgi:hypothetical protein